MPRPQASYWLIINYIASTNINMLYYPHASSLILANN